MRKIKDFLITKTIELRKKKYASEEISKIFTGFSESQIALITKITEPLKEKLKEDVLHGDQLIDMKYSVKYILQNSAQKQINVPLISLELKISDINGEIRTEFLNMTLAEFHKFKSEIKKMTEVLK